MKKPIVLGLSLCAIFALSSCKSQESAYKKAYEKARQQAVTEQQQTPAETTPVAVAPVQTTTPTGGGAQSDANVRNEKVQLINGSGIKDFSVVCGSFGLKANAEGLQQTLKGKGYDAQIVYNPANKFYRVVASTFDTREAAVQSRNQLRATYPDAWILYNK